MVVSLADTPEPSPRPAHAAAPVTAPVPEVIPPRPIEAPSPAVTGELPVAEPAAGGSAGEGGEVEGSPGSQGTGGGDDGIGGGASARYQPPRLLAGALPLTPQESESLPVSPGDPGSPSHRARWPRDGGRAGVPRALDRVARGSGAIRREHAVRARPSRGGTRRGLVRDDFHLSTLIRPRLTSSHPASLTPCCRLV